MEEKDDRIGQAVRCVMEQLAQAAVQTFDVAAARFETAERQAGLAQARRLRASDDPAERVLGERLEARILHQEPLPAEIVVDVVESAGVDVGPLSPRSSQPLPEAATGSPALERPKRRGPGRPRKSESDGQPGANPPRRGPGRPPKALTQEAREPQKGGPGRPASS